MKKNGFTLVELMGVIAVMAVLIVVVATNGFGVFNKAKSGIDKLEEDNLLEAARVFLVDVDNDLVDEWPDGCSSFGAFENTYCEVSVQYLEENDYFDDKADRCDDNQTLKLKIVEVDGVTTDYVAEKQIDTQVICKNS